MMAPSAPAPATEHRALVTHGLAWNVLFLLDGFVPWNPPKAPGPFVLLAVALVLAAAFASV